MRLRLPALAACLAAFVALAAPTAAQAAETLYPDLKTLKPRNLRFDRTDISQDSSGVLHNVLRFSNTVVNEGEGPVEIRALIDQRLNPPSGPAFQRMYNDDGSWADTRLGTSTLYYHAVHVHYHFDHWGEYQLWTKRAYDAWIASGRTTGAPDLIGQKTTSCVMDEEFVVSVARAIWPDRYPSGTCMPNSNGVIAQGLSSGWGDTYDYYRFEQWVDLGANGRLADGTYVLRSVSDPYNLVYESANKADDARESQLDNEAITTFVVNGGQIVDSDAPTGTVTINHVDRATSSPIVNLNLLGRDDVAGVTEFRVTNDNGANWKTFTNTSRDSNYQRISWDLSDPAYGGSTRAGERVVCVLFKDATGKWGPVMTDTIEYTPPPPVTSAYGRAVSDDAPAGWWRLGERSGTTALNQTGGGAGTYAGGVTLGQPALVPTESGNSAVAFNGSSGRVNVPSESALNATGAVTLEAWIKPATLPSSGAFRSVLSKAEAYSLQFNGPRLEFTIVQSGNVRRRLQTPTGAIAAGSTYHVVGTYDGSTQRIYLNGVQVASTSLSGAISTSTDPLSIGSWDGTMEYFNGVIDEAAVYRTALSASRVAAHYDAGRTTSLAAPTNLAGRPQSPTQIDLTWVDQASGESGIALERSTDSGFSSPTRIDLAANAQAYSDSGLTPARTYWYRVKAVNGGSSSAWSAAVQVATPAPASYAALLDSEHPISYWRLGETSGTIAGDETVVGPGTFVGSPNLGVPSIVFSDAANTAIGFNGATAEIRVGQTGSYDLTSALSLESWIKPTTIGAGGALRTIVGKQGSWALRQNGSMVSFTIWQSGFPRTVSSPAGALVAGITAHVAATFDGTTQRIYVNGVQVASASLSGIADTTINGPRLGSYDGRSEFFAGTIDETSIHGRALSAAQVLSHYRAGKAELGEPTDLAVAASTGSPRVDLWWTDNATAETAFVVQRSTDAAFSSPTSISLSADVSSFSDTRVAASTTYWYRVRAVTASDSSPWTTAVSATTAAQVGYAATIAASAPLSWWRLGETSGTAAADQQGVNAGTYQSSGTTLGAPSLLATTAANTAATLNGSRGAVRVPDSNSLDFTNAFSLEVWIKPTTIPGNGVFRSVLTKTEAYTIQFNGPRLEFTIVQGNYVRKRLQAPSGAIVAGGTYHVVATYDGTTQRLYLNGREVASVALSGGAVVTRDPLWIGTWDNTMEFFAGTVDEAAVYGRALPAGEIADHHLAGAGG